MIPGAAKAADAINFSKVRDRSGDSPEAPTTTETDPNDWRVDRLFEQPAYPILSPRSWPHADGFTLYLMATLARMAYGGSGQGLAQAELYLASALGGGWTRTVVILPGFPDVTYDLWREPAGKFQIIAFKGTTTLDQWLTFSLPQMTPVTGLGITASGYAGIVLADSRVAPLLAAPSTGIDASSPPTIMVGHSLGGAIAQLEGAKANVRVPRIGTNGAFRVAAEYSFGAPAWLGPVTGQALTGTLDRHCRVQLPGDPIPYSTELALAKANGLALLSKVLTPGFLRVVGGPRHHATREVELLRLNVSMRSAFRSSAVQALVSLPDALLTQLIDQHAIRSYCLATEDLAKNARATQYAPLASVQGANWCLDQSDAETPG